MSQTQKQDQVIDSIKKELEAYVDAVMQLELKNREYRPVANMNSFTAPRRS